jgi:hypothetical protein
VDQIHATLDVYVLLLVPSDFCATLYTDVYCRLGIDQIWSSDKVSGFYSGIT